MSDTYYQKYLKYKNKYLSLKSEIKGGMQPQRVVDQDDKAMKAYDLLQELFDEAEKGRDGNLTYEIVKNKTDEIYKLFNLEIRKRDSLDKEHSDREVLLNELLDEQYWYIIYLSHSLEKATVDNEVTKKELEKLQKDKDELDEALYDLKREKSAYVIQSNLRTSKSQAEIKQLEQENEKLRNQQKRVNDAVNRLTDFFRNRIVTPAPAVLVR